MRTDPEEAIERLLALLDLQGKVRLVTGANFWTTQADQTIGLRPMVLSDARSASVVSAGTSATPRSPRPRRPHWPRPGTSLLSNGLVGCWPPEARRKGVDLLLTPTVNLHRTPLGGRHFECLSEDPLLSGRIGAAYVRGLQAHGVAATAKHDVAKDSETNRFTVDVRVDEYALHELYLAPFEQLVVEGGAWLVMAAYNSVNGVTMTENPLLRDPLKTDWGSMAWSCPTGGRPAPLNQPPRTGWILLCRGRTAHGAPPWPPRSMMAGSRRRRWTTRYGASCGWQPASAPWKESRPTHPSRASRRRNRLRRRLRDATAAAMMLEAQAAGLEGLVVWGLHRDTADIRAIGLPVFSLGAVPTGPQRLDDRPQDALDSATIGDWTVTREDVVLGDDDSVLFVPAVRAGEILTLVSVSATPNGAKPKGCVEATPCEVRCGLRPTLLSANRPSLSFREHLRSVGGAIEE